MGYLRFARLPTTSLLGEAGINLGAQDVSAGNLINIFKAATLSFTDPTDALKVDSDGYLTSTPTNSVTVTFSSAGSTYVGSTYRMKWPSTIQFKMQFNSAMTLVGSATGATITGGTGSGATTITTTSGAGQVDFIVGASQPSCFFTSAGTFSRSGGELALYRVTDEADYLAGEYWTPEFRARLVELHLAYLRPMGFVNGGSNNFNGEVSWGYRIPTTALCWGGTRAIPTALVGNISGPDTYTCGASTDTPGTWTDGEVFTGNILSINTSTTCTINVNGRGAKNILTRAGAAIINTGSGSSRIVTGFATFRYDSVLDAVLYSPGLYQGSVPIEAQIQLANRVGTALWMVFPMWANDAYVTSQATLARDTLSGRAYYEYTNEVWQNTWPQTGWSRARGTALGWSSSSNQDVYGWYGLRVRQIMGNLIPPVYGGTLSAKVRRVLGYQGGGFLTIAANRLNGVMLNTGIGNATYSTITGSQNYDTFPNRPVDVVDSICYAPYTGGTNFCTGADIAGTLSTANAPFYQALVDAWLGGDSATAISMIDNDIRDSRVLVQNVTASGTTFTTPVAHGFVANTDDVYFDVSGGTAYSGITTRVPYRILTTPTSTTFTVQGWSGGVNTGSTVNAGSAGTGTMTVGRVGKNILYMTYWMPTYADTQAATYDAARTGAGMALLRADQYEGNLEPNGPTAAQFSTIGITGWTTTQAADACTAALEAWRNSSLARATSKHYYEAMTGRTTGYGYPAFTHNHHTSQLVLSGPGIYSLTSGPLPTDTPYQMYYGFQDFNLAYPQ